MPLGYLEGNPQDVYAINRLGATFSDALLGMQANRMKMQQQAAQQALEAAYYRLAQEKSARDERVSMEDIKRLQAETGRYTAETKRYEAETEAKKGEEQRQRKDFQSGGVMADATQDLYSVDPSKNPDVAAFLRGLIAQHATRIAASNPQNIAKQALMLSQSADPNTARLIATDTPAVMNVPAGGTLMDIANRKPLFIAPPRMSLQSPEQQQANRIRAYAAAYGALNHPDFGNPEAQDVLGALQNELGGMGVQQGGGGASRSPDRFPSEDAARKAGKKTGDRVYLQGVGLVELQ